MRVFITGGTGSLGKALAQKFHKTWDIVVFSRDELKQAQMKLLYPNIKFYIGDVRDYHSVYRAMKGADAVIHCAAMKRIEVCEAHPIEAVKTNVLGTENVVAAAKELGIERLVSIGSDKGVEPVNVYGMTKAILEKITVAAGYNCVRYGNVFGSRGSVVPLFYNQARNRQPLTITDPNMTRFILTFDEAIELIAMALENPPEGNIFVRKSSAARLLDIAKSFSDNIAIIGKMTGEKLHETLVSNEETTRLIDKDSYFLITQKKQTSRYGPPYSSDKERLLTTPEIKSLIEKTLPLFIDQI